MLLHHGWLATLSKPATINEDEEEQSAEGTATKPISAQLAALDLDNSRPYTGTEDGEVAAWVVQAMDRKRKGLMGKSETPALHKVALDTPAPA